MKTGIELIAEERQEQIHKHGFSLKHDIATNPNKELLQAAEYCLMLAEYEDYRGRNFFWPEDWSDHFHYKIIDKNRIDKLITAGAFLMAENERRGDDLHQPTIDKIAAEIDRLNKQ